MKKKHYEPLNMFITYEIVNMLATSNEVGIQLNDDFWTEGGLGA